MKRRMNFLFILAIFLALPLTALAAPVGKITALEGNVDITAGSKARDAKLGEAVNAGDILRAKSKSKAEVTFLDGNIVRLAENTRIRITDYQSGAKKTSILDLFRGKVQNIVTGLAKDARYEVRTPTAVCGVRGTNFIAFFQNGVSGFAPREGTIYGYNRTMPETVRTVTAGLAIMVLGASQPPTIQPMSSTDLDRHMQDATPMGPQGAPPSGGDTTTATTAATTTPTTVGDTPPPPPPPPPLPTMRNIPSTVPTTAPTTVSTTISTTVSTTVPTTSTTTVQSTTVPPTTIPPTTTTSTTTSSTTVPTTSTTTVQATTIPPTTIPPTTVPPTTIPPTTTSSTTVQTTVPTTVTTTIQTTIPTTVPTTSTTTIQTTVPTTISTTVLTTVPTTSTTTVAPTAVFPHGIGTPTVVFTNTDPNIAPDTGTIGLAVQYDPVPAAPGTYYSPVKEVGNLMWRSTGNNFEGFLTSLPGSWMGATSGIFYNDLGTRFGLFLGSLNGSYGSDPAYPGMLTANGGISRTPFLMESGSPYTGPLYDGLLGYLPGFSSISAGMAGPSYITAGAATLVPGYTMVYMTDQHFIEALATTDIGTGFNVIPPSARPPTWSARYGYATGNSFLVGGVTGSETVFNNILLSGRDLLYIDPNVMGYANFEYWVNLAGANPQTAGAATIEVKPLAFGGYWGYNVSGGIGCLLYNDHGFTVHAGDEWGLIGSFQSPWAGPAAITVAGTFGMDLEGYGSFPGYLWNSPINSRGYGYTGLTPEMIGDAEIFTYPAFASGEYFGYTAGRIGKFESYAHVDRVFWERAAQGDIAAVYVKDGQAGFLTTFDPYNPTAVTGGLAGYFSRDDATGNSGYWRLDGTLTATPMTTNIPAGGLSGRESPLSMTGTYSSESISLSSEGFGYTFNLYPTVETPQKALPWGIYAMEFDGSYSAPVHADLNGKNVTYGGQSLDVNRNIYFLGTLKNTSWTATIPGSVDVPESGQITGLFDGSYMSETEMGTFRGPFSGLYDEDLAGTGAGGWIGQSVGTYERTKPFAFSSPITATTVPLLDGIMGGTNTGGGVNDLWTAKTSDLWFMGTYDSSIPAPALWTGRVATSYSSIGGVYLGSLNLAVNDLNNLSGGVMALYTKSGKAGVLFSDDVSGTAYPAISMWDAGGTLQLYEMGNVGITEADLADPAKLKIFDIDNNYQVTPGKPVITAISGGLIDVQNEKTKTMRITGETWGIWSSASKGTYTGTTPENWVSVREEGSFAHGGGSGAEYLNVSMTAPVNGVSTGTVAGAWMLSNDPNPPAGIPASYTVVAGGAVKGLFNPSDPKTSMILSQGAFMETKAFINKVSGMDDAARENFQKATKIPSFQVGLTDLRGNGGVSGGTIDLGSQADMTKGILGATFFAPASGGKPQIWASGNVNGAFTGAPAGGSVSLFGYAPNGTGSTNGITANFNVTQWGATNWGATVTNGSAPVGSLTGSQGFVTSNAVGFQGGAAGSIISQPTGGPSVVVPGTFSGTAAGIVRQP